MRQKSYLLFPVFAGLIVLVFSFCQKEQFTTDTADTITFSTDTLLFDTVFTQLGSSTRILKLYNPHKKSIRVSKIYLENGAQSRFNLNVDGLPGDSFEGLEIAPHDSLYVFAEVTINPDQPVSQSPFILDENLVCETNGNVQKVVLRAWGQNAIYLPSRFGAGGVAGYGCQNGEWIWTDSLPYVIYGILVIDECTVRMKPGTHVYVHGGLGKEVTDSSVVRYNDGIFAFVGGGKLLIEGEVGKPVIFEGDRLESFFNEKPGQWTGIWLQKGTRGHKIENCIVRNSVIGIRVDSAADLTLKNTQIYNTANSGLIGLHAKIDAENCLFYSNYNYAIQLEWGGEYNFSYCTAATYGTDGNALGLSNVLCLDQNCEQFLINPIKARFNNCIFFGSNDDQISLYDRINDPSTFDYEFKNCIVRVTDLIKANAWPDFFDHCQPCLNAERNDTIFVDPNKYNFHLDTMHSIANRYGFPIPGIDKDLDGKNRDAVTPDVGCFEIEF